MKPSDLTHQRLYNQRLAGTPFERPGEVVQWFLAVQAQDYPGSLWGIGLRMNEATEERVEQAVADRIIVRTWPMRGTLHFVAAADIRWMLQLLAPRVIARNSRRLLKEYDLDEAVFARSRELLARSLRDGKQLTRNAIYRELDAAGIRTAGGRGLQILWRLAQEGLICFGTRQGRQHTFTLLEEWLPKSRSLARDEALAELTRRYFGSHGPATVQDFAWWSGLPGAEAQAGLEMIKAHLEKAVIGGREYWGPPPTSASREIPQPMHLLPAYDEYTVAYKDRSDLLDSPAAARAGVASAILSPTIMINGRVIGTWKRAVNKGSVVVTALPFAPLGKGEKQALNEAAGRYAAFLRTPVSLA
jgi:hypothetical protein